MLSVNLSNFKCSHCSNHIFRMGLLARQGFINSIIIYAGFGLGYVNVALLMPKFMSANEMGARETIVSLALILTQFGIFGLQNSFTKFFSNYKKLLRFGLVEYFLLAVSVFFILVSIVFFFFSDPLTKSLDQLSPITYTHLYLVYILGFILVLNSILESVFRNLLLSAIPVFLKEFLLRVMSTMLITFYAFNHINFTTFLTLFVLSYGLVSLTLLVILLKRKIICLRLPLKTLQIIDIKNIARYASYTFIIATAGILVIQIDKVMISSFINEYSTGIYTLAVYIATLIEIPKRAIVQTSSPLIAKAWAENNKQKVIEVLKATSIGQQLIGSLLFILLWSSIDSVYHIIPKDDVFITGKWVVLFIGLSKVLTMTFGATNEVLAYSSKYKFNLYFSVGIICLTVITNFSLIPKYGITGAALASLITITISNFSKWVFNLFIFQINCFSRNSLFVLLISLITLILGLLLPGFNNHYISIGIKSVLITSVFLSSIYFFKASPEFNGAVKKYILKK